jgi:histidyl-tRNA synthetase
MDKMDKVGWDGVAQRLAGKIFAEDQEESDGEAPQEIVLPESAIAAIRRFVELKCGNPEETLRGVRDLMGGIGIAMEGVDELEAMIANIRGLSVPVGNWTVDLSVARGLGYYTGPVFETILTDLPGIGSVFSGGRYDDLVKRFTGLSVPATGASVGVDRLFAAMEQMNLVPQRRNLTQVGILNFDPACTVNCERIATQLRRGGIRTELYLGAEKLLKDQLTYFIKRDVAYIVILGGNENAKGVVQLKDTVKREQGEIGQDDLVRVLKAKLDIL